MTKKLKEEGSKRDKRKNKEKKERREREGETLFVIFFLMFNEANKKEKTRVAWIESNLPPPPPHTHTDHIQNQRMLESPHNSPILLIVSLAQAKDPH